MAFLDLKSLKTEIDGKANKSVVTTSADGLMSASDKTKLNGIESGANNYSHPTSDGNKHVPANGTTNSGKFLQATATAGTYQWANVPLPGAASTSASGIVQLNDTVSSTSTTQAATANAVKRAYDLASSGQKLKLTHDDGRYIQTRDTGNIDQAVLGWFNYFNAKGTLPPGYSASDNDFLVENRGVGPDWIRQTLYDVGSYNKYERMRTNGNWSEWRQINDIGTTDISGVCRSIPNNNANDINITGFWMGSNVTNAPTVQHQWVYIESKVHNHLYQNQIATDLHDSSKRWTRHKTNGIWSEWRSL